MGTMEPKETKEWELLAASMRRALAENLTAALTVAGSIQEDDSVRKITITDLKSKTGIARSTLSKLTNGETASGIQANPDLETICRLAAAFNLPPAFLLMSADDWQRLLGALNGLPLALAGTYLDDLTSTAKGGDKVKVGLKLAEKLSLYPEKAYFVVSEEERDDVDHAEMYRDVDRKNETKRLAILTTTAVTQGAVKNRGDLSMLTAIGAIVGSSFNK